MSLCEGILCYFFLLLLLFGRKRRERSNVIAYHVSCSLYPRVVKVSFTGLKVIVYECSPLNLFRPFCPHFKSLALQKYNVTEVQPNAKLQIFPLIAAVSRFDILYFDVTIKSDHSNPTCPT